MQDVDDALSIHQLAGGGVQVGVHIADVSHFVGPGTLTDLEARARGTTVYLPDRRYDMLPAVLAERLCSLHERVCFWGSVSCVPLILLTVQVCFC